MHQRTSRKQNEKGKKKKKKMGIFFFFFFVGGFFFASQTLPKTRKGTFIGQRMERMRIEAMDGCAKCRKEVAGTSIKTIGRYHRSANKKGKRKKKKSPEIPSGLEWLKKEKKRKTTGQLNG